MKTGIFGILLVAFLAQTVSAVCNYDWYYGSQNCGWGSYGGYGYGYGGSYYRNYNSGMTYTGMAMSM